ncbi:hypothetical protein [Ferrimonas lipolytica]|uniref:glucose-6-phosphate 1-epimerase n=1 Tax=Ferrimonas lipolytica TaxID=2724191 RepID=A0A6H1UCT9_9GAMM|nr:hypothetical protein [Ferrimonas lipolytica]QIZ76854.1 hypothetical protein HER31_08200 [Ferrimonas lipolytica]
MSTITLSNRHNSVDISLYGGHVLSWHHNNQPIFWLSELADLSGETAIRGGVPICFPWFAEQGSPKHGFARTEMWQLIRHTETEALLELKHNQRTLEIWPNRFRIALTVMLSDDTLLLSLVFDNTDSKSWQFGGALHSYFSCDNARAINVASLDGLMFHNSLTGLEQQFNGCQLPNPIDAIVPSVNKIQFLPSIAASHTVTIDQDGNDSCVIWNPANNHPTDVSKKQQWQFICFESAIVNNLITLQPRQQHQLSQRISLSK